MLALLPQCLHSLRPIIAIKATIALASPRQRRQLVTEEPDALKETIVRQALPSNRHAHQDSPVLMMECHLLTQRLSYVQKGIIV